jgi:methylmalonyl-CoA mutase
MSTKQLLQDFSPSTFDEWKKQIEKDLRGKEYQTLCSLTADGFTIEPAYHRTNITVKPQPFKAMAKWDVVQELFVEDTKEANMQALDNLNRGATSLLFYLYGDTNLEELLNGIQIEYIRTNFVVEGDVELLTNSFKKLIAHRGLKEIEIAGSINIDCLESIARTGNWLQDEDTDFKRVKDLVDVLPQNIRGLCVNANLFGNAGATPSQQLGIALSMVYEYIHRFQLKSTQPFWVNFAIGGDYFGEIAKLRAWRRLWVQLHSELNLEPTEAFIYAETGMRNKTIMDAYNNMIRTTSESMAAAIGGANEISVKGFNQTYTAPDFFGERIAKNQQSILEHESHLSEVSDISKGSYFIETLTEQMAQKSWEFFKEIEARGGYVEAMKGGWLQQQIEAAAHAEQQRFDENGHILIGANKHAKVDENLREIIETGLFAGGDKETEVKRVVPRRLAEKLEK